jgi:hypothetical protein
MRKKNIGSFQIRPSGPGELLRAWRHGTASSRLISKLQPKLHMSEPFLCLLRAASPPDRAPDRPGGGRWTLRRGGRRRRGSLVYWLIIGL